MGRYPAPRTPQEECEARDRRLIEAIYSARYHRKNREERNRKTRLCMAALRAQDTTLPPEQLAARLAARRASAKKYREQQVHRMPTRNKWKIAKRAREARRAAKEQRDTALTSAFSPAELSYSGLRPTGQMRPGERQDLEDVWRANEANEARYEARRREHELQQHIALLKTAADAAEVYEEHLRRATSPCLMNTTMMRRGDLQKGESLAAMDFIFTTGLKSAEAAGEGSNADSDSGSEGMPELDTFDDLPPLLDVVVDPSIFAEYDSEDDDMPVDQSGTNLSAAELEGREAIRRVHAAGFVMPHEFSEIIAMYFDDDLELHAGFQWLQENWVRTFASALWLAFFLEYGQQAIWGVESDTELPAFAQRFPWDTLRRRNFADWEQCLRERRRRLVVLAGRWKAARNLRCYGSEVVLGLSVSVACRAHRHCLRRHRRWIPPTAAWYLDTPGLAPKDCNKIYFSADRCLVPGYPRIGPQGCNKIYLATGPYLKVPGAYTSWSTASAVIHGSSGATAPAYARWAKAVEAWQGGCDRNLHNHPGRGTIDAPHTPTPARAAQTPSWTRDRGFSPAIKMSPAATIPHCPRPVPEPEPISKCRDKSTRHCNSAGNAVLWAALGGLWRACFAEGFSPTEPTAEAEERRDWIASQQRVHRREMAELDLQRKYQADLGQLRREFELARLRREVVRLERELQEAESPAS
ncbi:hypothetical protein C8R43DRAFT_947983 [Mycena crocata]|nr:hypothetical protein C8R43DRAFT_947983 [Mycena crocata]